MLLVIHLVSDEGPTSLLDKEDKVPGGPPDEADGNKKTRSPVGRRRNSPQTPKQKQSIDYEDEPIVRYIQT